ncbi:MAG TPA: NADH-quinone oxidoreductase subunit J [Deltaproteobacteria bacterium]|nr:NADH-quinone oxidoreductase subunit J [Deltaproteobacteria bacterium]
MTLGELIFIFLLFVTFCGALTTVIARSLIYALVGLVATMFGIAGLYIYLNAPFIAMMQILIYVGAVAILIVFAIMLAGPFYKKPTEWSKVTKFLVSLIIALFTYLLFMRIILHSFLGGQDTAFMITTKDIGRSLFDKLTFPFELVSLLIVVSIIGALMLAIFSKDRK